MIFCNPSFLYLYNTLEANLKLTSIHATITLLSFLGESERAAQSCLTLWPYGLEPTRLLCLWNSSGKNTGVGCHSLLLGIFPPRDWTQVSDIAGRFLMVWTTYKYSNSCLVWLIIIQNTDIHVYTTTFHMSSDISKYWKETYLYS